MLQSFLTEEKALACVHCGLCLGACPTYLETGNENDSPRGRIYLMRALQSGGVPLNSETTRHLDLCLGCRACETACPSGVQYGVLLEETRDHIEQTYRRPWWQQMLRRGLIEQVFPYPERFEVAMYPARAVRAMGLDRWLPKGMKDLMNLLPENVEEGGLQEFWPTSRKGASRGRVGLVTGCVMQVLYAGTHRATIRLLNRAGYDVVVPRNQVCCGALHAHSGRLAQAREQARANIRAFENLKLDTILINAAGCGSTLKEYGHLMAGALDPSGEWLQAGTRFQEKVKDITEFLLGEEELLREAEEKVRQRTPAQCSWAEGITYHDACHLAHAQQITKAPRVIMKRIVGTAYRELPEADICCGSAGSYNLTEPEMAARLQERKIKNIFSTGAKLVVTTNPGCLMQIQAGLRARGAKVEIQHWVDFLDSLWK